jgi:hypothetical protein
LVTQNALALTLAQQLLFRPGRLCNASSRHRPRGY